MLLLAYSCCCRRENFWMYQYYLSLRRASVSSTASSETVVVVVVAVAASVVVAIFSVIFASVAVVASADLTGACTSCYSLREAVVEFVWREELEQMKHASRSSYDFGWEEPQKEQLLPPSPMKLERQRRLSLVVCSKRRRLWR